MKKIYIVTAALCAVSLASCTSPGKKTAIGAGGGAAAGAIIGGAIGGGKGALIGAAAGAAAGGTVGNYLDKQAKELEKVAETKRTDEGVMVNLKNDLLFDTGKADLKPTAATQLNQLGDILAKYPADRIRIAGFTDNTGEAKFNDELSDKRAEAVQDILAKRGVKPDQMLPEGFGESKPKATNDTAAGRKQNRRVELFIDVPPENTEQPKA